MGIDNKTSASTDENNSNYHSLVYDRTDMDLDNSKVSLFDVDMKIEVPNPKIVSQEGDLQFLLKKYDSDVDGVFFERESALSEGLFGEKRIIDDDISAARNVEICDNKIEN